MDASTPDRDKAPRDWIAEARPEPAPPDLGPDLKALVQIAVPHCLLPHPDVVAAVGGAIFPVIRGAKSDRFSVQEIDGRRLMVDDNTSPRWALLWSHGYRMTHPAKGWTIAHVWTRARDPDSYTHLANILMMPEPLASLSDKQGPLGPYLRFHAFDAYGWSPAGEDAPGRPDGYEMISWTYFEPHSDPWSFIRQQMSRLNNDRVRALAPLMGLGPGDAM
ncbi:hypothetical protein [Roseitranquillus sediminis]|uniref:hypothetical protein n=1 Tax=Roseitranquillus sediminis TaxID=2809051 RepID=UPI001D0CD3BB|nr:hypothetical protein [Roseitranquillus sediminis]MBM9593438.1 hypothetical protein [Roseitranquillus sediminis]